MLIYNPHMTNNNSYFTHKKGSISNNNIDLYSFNKNRLFLPNKPNNIKPSLVKNINNIFLGKHFFPATKVWFNSAYFFNKNKIRYIPFQDNIIHNIIKVFFDSVISKDPSIKNHHKNGRKKYFRINKIVLGKPEIKHTNEKIIINLYTFNRRKFFNLKKIFKLYLNIIGLSNIKKYIKIYLKKRKHFRIKFKSMLKSKLNYKNNRYFKFKSNNICNKPYSNFNLKNKPGIRLILNRKPNIRVNFRRQFDKGINIRYNSNFKIKLNLKNKETIYSKYLTKLSSYFKSNNYNGPFQELILFLKSKKGLVANSLKINKLSFVKNKPIYSINNRNNNYINKKCKSTVPFIIKKEYKNSFKMNINKYNSDNWENNIQRKNLLSRYKKVYKSRKIKLYLLSIALKKNIFHNKLNNSIYKKFICNYDKGSEICNKFLRDWYGIMLLLKRNKKYIDKNSILLKTSSYNVTNLSVILKIKNLNRIKNIMNIYYSTFFENTLKKDFYFFKYSQFSKLDYYKFNNILLSRLANIISNIYNKNIEFNIINLKHPFLDSHIFTSIIARKIQSRRIRVNRIVKRAIKKVKIRKAKSIPKYWLINRLKAFKNLKIINILKFKQWDDLDSLLRSYFSYEMKDKLYTKEKSIYNKIRHKHINGVKLITKGRLSYRLTASRSLKRIKSRGYMLSLDYYLRLPYKPIRGNIKPNLDYSNINSTTLNGSFGLKGWINTK